jgi:hypothetical protein
MRNWLKKLVAAAELVKITERIVACRDGADRLIPDNSPKIYEIGGICGFNLGI